jgi:hypothetical protein
MKTRFTILSLLIALASFAQTVPSVEIQIKTALLAAPEESKDKAMIYGYSDKGEFIVIRKGENDMVCLADDYKIEGLNVACYHKALDPYMERGRQLKKDGKGYQDSFDIREAEVKSGKLKLPEQPTTLFVTNAPPEKFNAATGEATDPYTRSVVYIPYATAESTGLPTKPPGPGLPWIMNPGTHRAHIMISPPTKN